MESRGFYNEILTEHNLRPEFKHDLPDADIVLEGVNPSCGDDIWLKLKVDGDVITDGAFVGDGFFTSPKDHSRIISGEAIPILIASNVA